MRRSYVLAAVAISLALLFTASLLAGLRHALGRRAHPESELTPRELERKRIREAMGDLLAPPIDFNNWPEHLRPYPGMPDRDTLRRSITPIDRPAWVDIREDRDGRG
jgi:hypothetical protein